jgi:hypothetical protein
MIPCDIARDTMTRAQDDQRRILQKRIAECEADIQRLRLESTPSRDDVANVAERLGRKLRRRYGSEPTYENELFPNLRTLTIPNKSPLKKGTKGKILNVLEGDIAAWQQRLDDLGGPIQ